MTKATEDVGRCADMADSGRPDTSDCPECGHMVGHHDGPRGECSRCSTPQASEGDTEDVGLRVGDVVLLDGGELGEVVELPRNRRTLVRRGASHQWWDCRSFRRVYRALDPKP